MFGREGLWRLAICKHEEARADLPTLIGPRLMTQQVFEHNSGLLEKSRTHETNWDDWRLRSTKLLFELIKSSNSGYFSLRHCGMLWLNRVV